MTLKAEKYANRDRDRPSWRRILGELYPLIVLLVVVLIAALYLYLNHSPMPT
jgi:hypothetical protein